LAIPDLGTIMLPLLRVAADGSEHSLTASVEILASEFALTPDERAQWNPSRLARTFYNRVAWAATYLRAADLIRNTARGRFTLTPRGAAVLAAGPDRVDIGYLGRFPEFKAFRSIGRTPRRSASATPPLPLSAPSTAIEPRPAPAPAT
jgi:restriction system protein